MIPPHRLLRQVGVCTYEVNHMTYFHRLFSCMQNVEGENLFQHEVWFSFEKNSEQRMTNLL